MEIDLGQDSLHTLSRTYNRAVVLLKNRDQEEGIAALQEILKHPEINSPKCYKIRYMTLISLGQACIKRSPQQALMCFEGVMKILSSQVQGPMLSKDWRQEQFDLTMKMILLTEGMGMIDRQIDLFKKALSISPKKWKKNIFKKLQELLKQHHMEDQLLKLAEEELYLEMADSNQTRIEKSLLQKVIITINVSEAETYLNHHSLLQKILTIAYVLLKTQGQRSLTSKPILAKLTTTEEWKLLEKNFEISNTQIELVFQIQKNSMLKDIKQEDPSVLCGDVVRQSAEMLLKDKQKDWLREYQKYQWHHRYYSLGEYCLEMLKYRGFRLEQLGYLSILDSQMFQSIFRQFIEASQEKRQPEQAQIKNMLHSTPTFESLEFITSQNQWINIQLLDLFGLLQKDQEDTLVFPNIIVFIQKITNLLIIQTITVSNTKQAMLSCFNLRQILMKCLTLVIEHEPKAFEDVLSKNMQKGILEFTVDPLYIQKRGLLLELINIKLEQLLMKTAKDSEFKQYQQQKIQRLVNFGNEMILNKEEAEYERAQNKVYGYLQLQIMRFACITNKEVTIEAAMDKLKDIHSKFNQQQPALNCFSDALEKLIKQYRRRSINSKPIEQQLSNQTMEEMKQSQEWQQITSIKKKIKNNRDLKDESYLQISCRLLQSFFEKMQRKSGNFDVNKVDAWTNICGMKLFPYELSQDFRKNQQLQLGQLPIELETRLLFNLIKLYLLLRQDTDQWLLRVIFFLLSIIFKQLQNRKIQILPFCLELSLSLMKYKKFPTKILSIIRRKFYSNLVVKNIDCLFDAEMHKERDEQSHNLLKLLFEVYNWPEFTVKKIQDSVGFLAFVYRYTQPSIQKGQLSLKEEHMNTLLNSSIQLFQSKRTEVVKYCEIFQGVIKLFSIINQDQKVEEGARETLVAVLKKQALICQCCHNLQETLPVYIQALTVLAFHHAKQPCCGQLKERPGYRPNYSMLDEQYLTELIILCPSEPLYWLKLIEANYLKVCAYYDSLVGKPFTEVKNKLDILPRLASLATTIIPDNSELVRKIDYYLQVMYVLKVRQRQYRMIMTDIEWAGSTLTKDVKEAVKHYKGGLKWTLNEVSKNDTKDVKIRALRLLEYKLRLAWVNTEKETRLDEKKQLVVIELDEYQGPGQKLYHPVKVKNQVIELIAQTREIIRALKHDPHPQQVAPLEEQLIMEIYIFLFQSMQWKLQKIISRLCEVIRVSSKTDQCRKLKEMQHTFNELEYIVQIFNQSAFLSNKPKYKLTEMKQELRKKEEVIKRTEYQFLFQSTFSPKEEEKGGINKTPMKALLDAKYGKPRGRKETINLSEVQIQDLTHHISKDKARSLWANRQRKITTKTQFNLQNHIHVGKYFYLRLKQFMSQNQAAATRFNSIHSVIGSWMYYNLLASMSRIMQQLLKIFKNVGDDIDRGWNRRTRAMAKWTSSMIVLRYAGNWQKAQELIEEVYNIHLDHLVFTHIGDLPQQSVFPISELFHRSIVLQITKRQYIDHLFRLFSKAQNVKAVMVILGRVTKLSKGHADYLSPEDLQIGVKMSIGLCRPFDDLSVETNIKFYYYMLQIGSVYLGDLFRKLSKDEALTSKMERNMLRVRDEVRFRVNREDTNFYMSRLQQFINDYEKKYKKREEKKYNKFRMRRKERQNKRYRKPRSPESYVKKQEVEHPTSRIKVKKEEEEQMKSKNKTIKETKNKRKIIHKKKSKSKRRSSSSSEDSDTEAQLISSE